VARRSTPRKPKHPTPAQKAQWRGISRIEQPSTRTFGWFVRIGFRTRRDGSYAPRHTKFFGDASHGGPHKALRAARAWRDTHLPPAPKATRGQPGPGARKARPRGGRTRRTA
jgi:hypothetical protein